MSYRVLRADDYLEAGECYHIARISLPIGSPRHPHSHDFFEMFFVESGVTHHLINGEHDRLNAGDLVFIRPDDQHAIWSSRSAPSVVTNLMFRVATIEGLWARYAHDLGARFFKAPARLPEKLRLLQNEQFDLRQDFAMLFASQPRQIEIDGFLTRLLAICSASSESTPLKPLWLNEGLKRANEPVFLRMGAIGLAAACGKSQEHVARVLKRQTGKTASEIMNQKRMVLAARLLLSTDQSIEAVSLACGIENQSYFYRLFKAQHAATPHQFRTAKSKNPVIPS